MSKQDRQGVRSAADLERKYKFGDISRSKADSRTAQRSATVAQNSASEAIAAANKAATAAEEASKAVADVKTAIDRVEAQAVYTAMMTDTLIDTAIKAKITAWHSKALWTDAMVNKAVDKGILSSAEAAEIIG